MQKFSYHTHTDFSDGSNTLEQMLQQAVNLGWEEIGISDHLIVHKNITQSISYKDMTARVRSDMYHTDFKKALPYFNRHAEIFRQIAKKYPIKVYLGYETDYFTYNGWLEEFKEFISQIDHDYLISGNHFFTNEDGTQIIDISQYKKHKELRQGDSFENYLRRHYQTLIKAVESGMFNFLAHLDYARKVPEHADYPMLKERINVVSTLAKHNIGCEISTKGLRKIGDYFPENNILEELVKQKVPLVISDDAHQISELGYAFDNAEIILEKLNCTVHFRLK